MNDWNEGRGVGRQETGDCKTNSSFMAVPARTEPCGSGLELSPIAFGSQTVSRSQGQRSQTHGDSRLCVPASRQVCLYRCAIVRFYKDHWRLSHLLARANTIKRG